MKKTLSLVLTLCMLCAAASAAMLAVPQADVLFRTGPDKRYAPSITMPAGSEIIAIQSENNWALCCFVQDNVEYYGYAPMGVAGAAPDGLDPAWNSYFMAAAVEETQVYSAPVENCAAIGRLFPGEIVRVLTSNGTDTHFFIEFYDGKNQAPSRGWVDGSVISVLQDNSIKACYMKEASPVYAAGDSSAETIGRVFQYEMVGHLQSADGFDQILFYNNQTRGLAEGYVPSTAVGLR